MPSPSLSNDYGFPHADSILTCLKSSGPPVPGSLGALKVQLLNHDLVLRAEPQDQTRFHTCSLCAHPYYFSPFPRLLDQTWAASLHSILLTATEALPVSCGDLGSQDQTLTLCWGEENPGSPPSQQPIVAGQVQSQPHPSWHAGDLLHKHEAYAWISILTEKLSFYVRCWTSLDPSAVVGTSCGGWYTADGLWGGSSINCHSWLLPVQVRARQYTQLQFLHNRIALKREGSWWNIKVTWILTYIIAVFGHLF